MAPIQPQQPQRVGVTNPMISQPRPMAPGKSPIGGTTHLPQHLQTRGTTAPPPGMAQALGAGVTNPGTSPAAPTPASQPPATVPAAPPRGSGVVNPGTNPAQAPPAGSGPPVPPAPPAPPAAPPPPATPSVDPAATAPAAPTDQQAMGDELYKQLMEMLHNPSRYGAEQAQATRTQGYQKLDDERKLAEDRATADAAKRGVYHGTPLTNSLGDIGERYLRGGADLETNIDRDQAQNFQNDRMNALKMIFEYGANQRLDKKQQDDLWLELLRLGYVGGPDMPNPSSQVPIPGQG